MGAEVTTPLRTAVALAALAGGCVIPVGPQFDDPETNYPPYVVTSTPSVGEIFTPGGGDNVRDLSVTLSDFNVRDNLYIRFLVDYPGADTGLGRLIREFTLAPPGIPERTPIHIQPSCKELMLSAGPHRLVMAVADRPYLDTLLGNDVDPESPLDSVPQDAMHIRVVWTLNCTSG